MYVFSSFRTATIIDQFPIRTPQLLVPRCPTSVLNALRSSQSHFIPYPAIVDTSSPLSIRHRQHRSISSPIIQSARTTAAASIVSIITTLYCLSRLLHTVRSSLADPMPLADYFASSSHINSSFLPSQFVGSYSNTSVHRSMCSFSVGFSSHMFILVFA